MLIDLLTSTCRSTQVKIASTDLWPQGMFTFSEMLALVESESNFGAYACHRRPGGSLATSDLVKGIIAKREILKRKRKVEGRGRGRERKRKGKGEREIGSEALAETEKIANAPAGNRTRDPSKRGWCSTIKPPRQATSPASLFEILSVLPKLHNIGIIQCPQTKSGFF